ncbi:MAG: hypothetical protein GWN62_16655, partial [Aliifodinibius sp.]|nr:hypothetical protein [Fodinibius sp.]
MDRHGLYPLPADIRTFIQSATPASRKLQLWTKFPQWRMDFKNELWIWWRKSGADQPSPLLDSGAYRAYDDTWRSVLTMVDGANPIDDETMYNNAATGFGNLPNYVDGKIYRAQDLNGTTDYMTIAADRTMSPRTGVFSIACWIYPHVISGTQQIFSERTGTGGQLEIEINSSGNLNVYSSGLELTSVATLSIDTWYHIVLIRDSGNTLRLYINGVQDNSVGSFTDDIIIDGDLHIGRDYISGQFFNGLLDQFMWNVGRALTAYDVKAMYENQNGPSNLMTPGEGMDVDLFWGYEYEQEFAIPASQIDADIDDMPVLFTEANLPAGIF